MLDFRAQSFAFVFKFRVFLFKLVDFLRKNVYKVVQRIVLFFALDEGVSYFFYIRNPASFLDLIEGFIDDTEIFNVLLYNFDFFLVGSYEFFESLLEDSLGINVFLFFFVFGKKLIEVVLSLFLLELFLNDIKLLEVISLFLFIFLFEHNDLTFSIICFIDFFFDVFKCVNSIFGSIIDIVVERAANF